jgi:hypothetical protein
MYLVAQPTIRERPIQTIFASTNTDWHSNLRRAVSSAFSMTPIVKYEAYVDDTINVFLQELGKRFDGRPGTDGVINIPKWLRFYAEDTVATITYGKRVGNMESVTDHTGIIALMDSGQKYIITVRISSMMMVKVVRRLTFSRYYKCPY